MSIQIEELAHLLNEVKIEVNLYNQIIQNAEKLEEEKKQERELSKVNTSKNEFVVLVKTDKELTSDDIVAHVFSIPLDSDPNLLIGKITKAGTENNLASKRKNNLVTDFDDIPHIKRKFYKEEDINLKTKEDWCRVVVLPKNTKFGGFESKADNFTL